jgi:signal transduction histidine kinase
VQIDPDLALLVDRKLTVAALRNLVESALDFTDAGPVVLRSEDRGHEVVLHLQDHCEGVAKEELGSMFEPYRRPHRRRPSSGFGLSVARRATEAQGGHVGVESSPDHGCHFWLTLRKAHN